MGLFDKLQNFWEGKKPMRETPMWAETAAQFFGVGERRSALLETIKKPAGDTLEKAMDIITDYEVKKSLSEGKRLPSTGFFFPLELTKTISEGVVDIAKTPFKIAKTAIYRTKEEPATQLPILGEITSYGEDVRRRQQELMGQGIDERTATIATILGVGGEAVLDISILGNLITGGLRALAKGKAPSFEARVGAWKLLGQPKTAVEVQKNFHTLSHQFHPYKGGSEIATKELNNAYDILNKAGIPDLKAIVAGKLTGPITKVLDLPNPKFVLPFKMLPSPDMPVGQPFSLPLTDMKWQGGFIKIPDSEPFVRAASKALAKVDIEAPYRILGAPDTGFAVKNFLGRYSTETERAKDLIGRVSKIKGLVPDDFVNTTYLSAQPDVMLPTDIKNKISPVVKQVRSYLDFHAEQLKKYEVISDPFPESFINRSTEEIRVLEENLKTASAKQQPKLAEEIDALKGAIDFVKAHNIKYVPIPTRVWLEDFLNKVPNAPMILNRFFQKRKTVDIKGFAEYLINQGIITKSDVDIRNILASYSRKVGWTYGWSDIIQNARKEGLIKPKVNLTAEQLEKWTKLPSWIAPELKGEYINPVLSNVFERTFAKNVGEGYKLSRPLAYVKMMQFDNPLFVGLYDSYQGTWLMLGESLNSMIRDKSLKPFLDIIKSVGQSAKSMVKKDTEYWLAMENGLQSKPYIPNFEDFMKEIDVLKENSTIKRTIKQISKDIKFPPDIIFRNLWHLTWDVGDKFMRLWGYHFLRNSGYISRDAAQVAALHYGDYAMMPKETRQILNKIFFTPVFPVTMAKLHEAQMEGMIKSIASAARAKTPEKKNLLLATSLMVMVGGIYARKKIMEHYGFEEKDFGYRYEKQVTDPETGEKRSLMVTIPSPDNRWLRYYHKLKTIPDETDKAEAILNKAKWELHPLWQTMIGFVQNKKDNADPIYNIFDEPQKIAVDTLRWATGDLVRTIGRFDDYSAEEKKNAERAMLKDMDKIWFYFLKPVMNFYLTYIPEEKIQFRLNALDEEFSKMLGKEIEVREREKKPPVSEKELEEWTQNLIQKMDDILKELPEYKEEKLKKEPLVSPEEDFKDKEMLIDEFFKDFNLPTGKEKIPKEIQFPEEKPSQIDDLLDFNLKDVIGR